MVESKSSSALALVPVAGLAEDLKETVVGGKPFKPTKEVKLMDQDIARLSNRLHHLKFELEKTKRQTSETSQRAEEIKKLKQTNKIKLEKKGNLLSNLSGKSQKQREEIRKRMTAAKERRKKKQQEREDKLRQDALELKRQRDEIKRKKEEVKRATIEGTYSKVKQARLSMQQKKEEQKKREKEMEQKKLESARKKLQEKMQEYERVEREVQRLEEIELEWINKLNHIQEEQRGAYSKLEAALS